MYDDGFKNLYNIDISSVCIEQMRVRNRKRKQMIYEVMDCCDLKYPDNYFDIAIDKSTIDASKIDKKKKSTVPEPAPAEGDYADYYQRVKMMAKDKGMKDEDMQKLLKDRLKGEEAYKKVSILILESISSKSPFLSM